MLKYPIGIQDFRFLRERGFVYIDKTEYIHRLVDRGKWYFLSRPRRFGKSLMLSVMNELYTGGSDLFEGLWINNHWDFEKMRRPVVWLKFASLPVAKEGLEKAIEVGLARQSSIHNIPLTGESYTSRFYNLLYDLKVRDGRVVLLIDEYDKPIVDYLDDPDTAEQHREILQQLYTVLKDSDPYLELTFITGVSAFSKVSIFSGLNNLNNITLKPAGAALLGITEPEIERYLAGAFDDEKERETVRRWYNGYRWASEVSVYNPFSLMNYLESKRIGNYWFETGTPNWLVKMLSAKKRYDLENVPAYELDLLSFTNLRDPDPITLLFQTGYLTMKELPEPGDHLYRLDYPNLEVRQSFALLFLHELTTIDNRYSRTYIRRIVAGINTADLASVRTALNEILASVPYDLWTNNSEYIYHALIHLIFTLVGVKVRSEVHTHRGRCDALVETEGYRYIFEFKRNQSAAEAIQQIKDRDYAAGLKVEGIKTLAVGVNFDDAERQITDWIVTEI